MGMLKMGSYLWKKPRRDPWEIRTRQCAGSGQRRRRQGLQTLSSRVNDPQNTFVLTVGMMNGGTQSNIIADEVELVGTTLPSTSTKTPSRMAVPSMHDLPSTV